MPTRMSSWAMLIWTAFMATGIAAAALGIGNDCVGLAGSELGACQAEAWVRGTTGLILLVGLWLAGIAPLAIFWAATRPRAQQRPSGQDAAA